MAFYPNKFKVRTIYPNLDAKKFYSFRITYGTLWKSLLSRLEIQKDAFILITGTTGSGKSTISAKMNFRYAEIEPNSMKNDKEMMFIPEKHFIVDGDEFAYKMITETGSSL